ncbi:hypothetical protein NFI96_023445 [Prochilodus magdalenae]|nr:hypothetical protein NFI96_023445 [Prochilodus magdalenae]
MIHEISFPQLGLDFLNTLKKKDSPSGSDWAIVMGEIKKIIAHFFSVPRLLQDFLLAWTLKYAACRDKNRESCFNRHTGTAQTDLAPALGVLLNLSDAAVSDAGLDPSDLITIILRQLIPKQCGCRLDGIGQPAELEPLTVHLI